MITTITRSALLMHSAERMYQLVNDVESYPGYMHGCSGAEILEQGHDYMVARLDLSARGVNYSFATRNRLTENSRIELNLEQGPFKQLRGEWLFKPLTENACKVTLDLSFEFQSTPIALASTSLFSSVANNLLDAVVARADKIYAGK